MKKLIVVNGTMGVGKTAVCNELHRILKPSLFLDGDWCWDMNPFIVNDETKIMVEDNITHLLNNFLICLNFDYVIFCWVLHEEVMIEKLLARLNHDNHEVYIYTLICAKEVLSQRLMKDVEDGIREKDVIERSISRLSLYDKMKTAKIDVSNIDQYKAARIISEGMGE